MKILTSHNIKALNLILMMILLVGTISALDFDNVKSYSKIGNYGKIEIRNSVLGIPFLKLGKIADYTLLKNTDNCLTDCYSEGTAQLYEKGLLFSELNFKNKSGLDKNINYKLLIKKNITWEIIIEDKVEDLCKDVLIYGEYYEKVCTYKKIGEHTEKRTKEIWEEYKGEILDPGIYEWRIEGKIDPGESIDWVGESFGVKFTEWAWWNSDWLYYKNITLTTTVETENEMKEGINITGLSLFTDDCYELRILNSSGDEIPYNVTDTTGQALGDGSEWCVIRLTYNKLEVGTPVNYSAYYGNSLATAPAYIRRGGEHYDDSNVLQLMRLNDANAVKGENAGSSGVPTYVSGAGKFDNAMESDNNDDGLFWDPANFHDINSTRGTVEFWYNYSNAGGDTYLWDNQNPRLAIFYVSGTFHILSNSDETFAYSLTNGQIYHFAYSWNENLNVKKFFVNGVQIINASLGYGVPTYENYTTGNMSLARRYTLEAGDYVSKWGRYDEMMLSNIFKTSFIGANVTYSIGEEVSGSQNNLNVTLTSPENSYNTTLQNISFNCSATDDLAVINLTLILDGIDNYTITNSTPNSNLTLEYDLNISDGDHNWTCRASDGSGQVGDPSTASIRTFNISTTPGINFTSPTLANATNWSENYIPVAVNVITPYLRNITYELQNVNGSNFTLFYENETYNVNFSNVPTGNYNYNVTVCTTTGKCNNTETRYLVYDINYPIISITNLGLINYHISGNNLTVNWSVTDANLDSCIFEYAGINQSVNCSSNGTYINATSYNYKNVTLFANDTLGNYNSSVMAWNYNIFEHNQTFNNNTIEGSVETFSINFTKLSNLTLSAINLNYNGTINLATFGSGSNAVATVDVTIPDVNSPINITFYWQFVLSNLSSINSENNTQFISNISIDNCAVYNNSIYNFTVVDEKDQTLLTGADLETEIDLQITSLDGSQTILSFSNLINGTNPLRICTSLPLNSSSYLGTTIVRYTKTGYANEYYNIVNFTLNDTNTPQNITLYDLNASDSTDFQLTFTGSDFLPVENALVYVNRQYIAESTFKTVELPKTDSNGQTLLHLVRNDVIYNLVIIKGGEVLGTFENIIAFCEDYSIGDCTISLNALSSVGTIYNVDEDLGIIFTSPYFNETTRDISFDYYSDDGTSKIVTMEVTRHDVFGNLSVCNDTLASASGTLSCHVNDSIEDAEVRTNIYVNGNKVTVTSTQLDKTNYGAAGYLVFMIMAMSIILLFTPSKTAVLVGIGLSLFAAIGLSLVIGNVIGVGAAGLFFLIVLIYGIWKLNKERIQ